MIFDWSCLTYFQFVFKFRSQFIVILTLLFNRMIVRIYRFSDIHLLNMKVSSWNSSYSHHAHNILIISLVLHICRNYMYIYTSNVMSNKGTRKNSQYCNILFNIEQLVTWIKGYSSLCISIYTYILGMYYADYLRIKIQ